MILSFKLKHARCRCVLRRRRRADDCIFKNGSAFLKTRFSKSAFSTPLGFKKRCILPPYDDADALARTRATGKCHM